MFSIAHTSLKKMPLAHICNVESVICIILQVMRFKMNEPYFTFNVFFHLFSEFSSTKKAIAYVACATVAATIRGSKKWAMAAYKKHEIYVIYHVVMLSSSIMQ